MNQDTEARRVARDIVSELRERHRVAALRARHAETMGDFAKLTEAFKRVAPGDVELSKLLHRLECALADHWSLDHAQCIIRADYMSDVRCVAEDIAERVADGLLSDADEVSDALHESVDGDSRVIYTFKARLGLFASDNEGACEEQTGEAPESPEVGMYWALRADVEDELHDLLALDSDAWEGGGNGTR